MVKQNNYSDAAKSGSDRISVAGVSPTSNIVVELVDVYGFKYARSGATADATGTTDVTAPTVLPSDTTDESPSTTAPTLSLTNPAR